MLRSLYADLNVAIRLARPIDWETDDPVLPTGTLTATAAVDKEAESLLPPSTIVGGLADDPAEAAPSATPRRAPAQRGPGRWPSGRGQGHQRAAGTAVATAEATVTVAATAAVARRNPHNPLSTRTTHAAYKRHENDARLRGCPPTLRELFDMVWKAQYAEMPDSLSASARAEQATALVLIKLQNQMDAHRDGGRNERQQPFLEGLRAERGRRAARPGPPKSREPAPAWARRLLHKLGPRSTVLVFNWLSNPAQMLQVDPKTLEPALRAVHQAIMDRYGISMRKTGYKAPPRPTRAWFSGSAPTAAFAPQNALEAAAIIYPEA
eukprot:tig00000180_g13613.t1